MKTHFYPFTDQAKPVPLNVLVKLGVPAMTVAELVRRGFSLSAEHAAPKGGDRG